MTSDRTDLSHLACGLCALAGEYNCPEHCGALRAQLLDRDRRPDGGDPYRTAPLVEPAPPPVCDDPANCDPDCTGPTPPTVPWRARVSAALARWWPPPPRAEGRADR